MTFKYIVWNTMNKEFIDYCDVCLLPNGTVLAGDLNYEDEEVETYKSAQDIYFIVKKSTKLRYNPFNFENEEVIFNRLTEFDDITHVTLVYSDESRQTIAVPYEERYGGDNNYQSYTYIHGFDELIINIKEEEK